MEISDLLNAVGNATGYTLLIVSGGLIIRTLWLALKDERAARETMRLAMQSDINALQAAALVAAEKWRELSTSRILADNEQTRANMKLEASISTMIAQYNAIVANLNTVQRQG